MWTPWPSAPPTPRHGSWSCRSGRRRGDAGAPLGRCTRWRPPRNRRCSSRQSGFRTPSCRSSSPSAWRESAGVAGSATHRRRGGAATGRSGAGGHGALGPGEAEGVISQAGELRCCADATVRALERVVHPKLGFELLGVKAVRAFDATVVIVSLSARQEARASRLVGAYLTEDDPPRGAALAVLNATNRILGNFFATR